MRAAAAMLSVTTLWIPCAAGVFLIVLVYAHLAARIPITGFAYQWNSRLINPHYGWFTGYTAMLAFMAGTAATAVCFTKTQEFSLLPSDLDGATLPPSGEPNFFVDLFSTTTLHLFKFHVDFVTPANSRLTGPTVITVPGFTPACPSTFTCVPQGSTTQQLDSLGDRLMFRMPYRNFGTRESLVITHSVKSSTAASAIRWYEIRTPNTTPSVFQKGTFGGAPLASSTNTDPAWTRRIRQELFPSSMMSPRKLSTAKSSSTVPMTIASGSAITVYSAFSGIAPPLVIAASLLPRRPRSRLLT